MFSVSLTKMPKLPSYNQLRESVLASYACHNSATRLFGEIVSHLKPSSHGTTPLKSIISEASKVIGLFVSEKPFVRPSPYGNRERTTPDPGQVYHGSRVAVHPELRSELSASFHGSLS
jgi:hypothetical protein